MRKEFESITEMIVSVFEKESKEAYFQYIKTHYQGCLYAAYCRIRKRYAVHGLIEIQKRKREKKSGDYFY